jgi:hypothetical protein
MGGNLLLEDIMDVQVQHAPAPTYLEWFVFFIQVNASGGFSGPLCTHRRSSGRSDFKQGIYIVIPTALSLPMVSKYRLASLEPKEYR